MYIHLPAHAHRGFFMWLNKSHPLPAISTYYLSISLRVILPYLAFLFLSLSFLSLSCLLAPYRCIPVYITVQYGKVWYTV